MTTITQQTVSPIAHLTPEDIEQIGIELDAIRQEVLDTRGAADAAYIRKMVKTQRYLELGSRAVLLGSLFPPAFVLGAAGLGAAKVLENMELGHNIMHGQWDWMRDPKIHSTTWEWDNASPSEGWKHTHNEVHHTFTNIVGKDNDLGYGIFRADEEQSWAPYNLVQPVVNFLNMLFFQYGIAAYDCDASTAIKARLRGEEMPEGWKQRGGKTLRKIRRHASRDYLLWPLLSGPSAPTTLVANVIANGIRNVWSHSVIMCGHFPEGVETFELAAVPEKETRGEWYLRQMLGSANISGPKALHIASGNLSHQIEHHLWPDLPSNRYAEVAPKVRALFAKYGLSYNTRPMPQQVASAWHRIVRLSLPNGWLATTNRRNLVSQLRLLGRIVKAKGDERQRLLDELELAAV